jgi:uncharacterized OsmC-like protein
MSQSDATETDTIRLQLEQDGAYGFRIRFDDASIPALLADEPAPLGEGRGPNPSAMLLAAVANCLGASLLFALRKFKNAPGPIRIEIEAVKARNEAGRWRIPKAQVRIQLADRAADLEYFERTMAQFEQFCIVTQSVREGIEVDVVVIDAAGDRFIPGDGA